MSEPAARGTRQMGRRAQYAIRILGATGRTCVLRFHPGTMGWVLMIVLSVRKT